MTRAMHAAAHASSLPGLLAALHFAGSTTHD